MFEKEIVIDAKGHLVGRLASIIAKQLLSGQRIVIVRCERVNISGSLFRNKLKMKEWYRKCFSTNPRRGGPWHYKAPSRLVWRKVRGMLPHKSPRGEAALARLKCFDGVPHPFDQRKRVVVPDALKAVRLKNYRKYCVLGDLCKEYGWKAADLIEKLEERRKEKSQAFHERKVNRLNIRRKAQQLPELKALREKLAAYGY